MTLPVFDPQRHHIGLGPRGSDPFGFLLNGGYNRDLQRYGTPTEFGGTDDRLKTPVLARWTQDDFSGGGYQYGLRDAAMFADSFGLLPIHGGTTLRTVPPIAGILTEAHISGSVGIDGTLPLLFHATKDQLHVFFPGGRIRASKFDSGTGYSVETSDAPVGDAGSWSAAAIDTTLEVPVAVLVNRNTKKFDRFLLTTGTMGDQPTPGDWDWHSSLSSKEIDHIEVGASYYTLDVQGTLYTLVIPEDGAEPTDVDWTKIGRLPGRWKASLTFNGWVYILLASDAENTRLVAFDGTSILPICDFPYNFTGECMQTYGGRIFVGGSSRDISGDNSFGELYEVNGASLRLVRTFHPESRTTGTNFPECIYSMAVHEGLLFFGQTGAKLIAYDLTTDSFHGGPQLMYPDANSEFRFLVSSDEKLWAWVHKPLDVSADGIYRPMQPGDESYFDAYTPFLITSDFYAEPDRYKRWSQMRITTRYGSVEVGYSTSGGAPGGDTFTALPISTVTEGDFYHTTVDLSGLDPSKQIRFRIRLPRGKEVGRYAELIGYTVSFLFLDTGQWAWGFTVNGAERVERALTTDTELQDTQAIREALSEWSREREPLSFTDLDGQTFDVQITDFREAQPIIGLPNEEGSHEAFYSISLIEV